MSTEKSAVTVEDTPAEIPQLGALEEDDEFEEFPKLGKHHHNLLSMNGLRASKPRICYSPTRV